MASGALLLVNECSPQRIGSAIKKNRCLDTGAIWLSPHGNIFSKPFHVSNDCQHFPPIAVQCSAIEASLKTIIDPLYNRFNAIAAVPEFRVSGNHTAVIIPKWLCASIQMTVLAIHDVCGMGNFSLRPKKIRSAGNEHSSIPDEVSFGVMRNLTGVGSNPYRIRSGYNCRDGLFISRLFTPMDDYFRYRQYDG